MSNDGSPESVEEAGALLGAAITRCGVGSHTITLPPKGMHSSFATISPVPASELLDRLYSLRSLLRSAPQGSPLVAAPSLLAVLMKLLGVSSSLASTMATLTASSGDASKRVTTPPMLSTPLRKLWVDCIVLCHQLGEGLTGNTRIDTYAYVRSMLALASVNPKSVKAAGGTRIAAVEVVGVLMTNPTLIQRLAPWALDVLQVCHRALKSSGNGEPTFRIASMRTACCVAVACRNASLISRPLEGKSCLVLRGALEDKAILETVRLLRQATGDKFPEVRSAAAKLAAMMAPMLVSSSSGGGKPGGGSDAGSISPTSSLEDAMTISMKNLDDESPDVALGWAEALARFISTAIEYKEQSKANVESENRRKGDDEESGEAGERKLSRKASGHVVSCATLNAAVSFLVDQFIKVGGELAASRGGGPFSTGGRGARLGLALVILKLIRLQSKVGSIGEGVGLSIREVILHVLKMVGPAFEKQLNIPVKGSATAEVLDATSLGLASVEKSVSSSLFGQSRNSSPADAGLARLAASRVLRQGLSEVVPEPTQLSTLHALIDLCKINRDDSLVGQSLNAHQLQVVLIELSHLFTVLGEASASALDDAVENFKQCLTHVDHGVRHEAAIACASLATSFNVAARRLIRSSVDEFQLHHAELFALASTSEAKKICDSMSSRLRRFRQPVIPKQEDPSLAHQCAVHGYALMVSVLLRELPQLPGGLPVGLLSMSLSAAEILISCQHNEVMTLANPSAACTCVRAGYGIICGALTTGTDAIATHIAPMFGSWQKSCKSAVMGGTHFTTDHDLICLEAMVSSIVVFLSYCSELLLAVPDALSRTTLVLEEVLQLLLPGGRLGNTPSNPAVASRYESAIAGILEAFAWLPPGSFPMAADNVFSFAASHIHYATEEEVTCSILSSLVNKEDGILDAKSLSRACRVGQVGGARDLEETIIGLTSDIANHGEREAVLHLQVAATKPKNGSMQELRGSSVLGLFAFDCDEAEPPTPLHEVGTWRKPIEPFRSTKVRLVDASIQAFAATFGMKGGKEQQAAVDMLETLVPPLLAQLARVIGVNSALTESERRVKSKEDNAAVANITAVLLACLKSLPLHEATHDVPVGLGPPWMNKAKDLLLTLMPSASNVIRRAATEGLALLATLGVTEDAHFLQSTVLHSLDEVMQGNNPDGKPKAIPLEPVSAARAGSLLTLACIQRTARNIQRQQRKRIRNRTARASEAIKQQEDALPTLQMMTRILPSVACHGYRDAFVVRTYALYSLGLLLAYSGHLDREPPTEEDVQLIRKAVEIIEDNFLASWTAASGDWDRGMEAEKLGREASFLAVLLRLMTFLVPSLHHLIGDPAVASRLSSMASLALECFSGHAVVFVEGMAFFERLASFQFLLPPQSPRLLTTENPLYCCVPFVLDGLTPDMPDVFASLRWPTSYGCLESPVATWAVVRVAKVLWISHVLTWNSSDARIVYTLYALLEVTCAARCFPGCSIYRPLAAPRGAEMGTIWAFAVEIEITEVFDAALFLEQGTKNATDHLLRWILLSRALLIGAGINNDFDESGRDEKLKIPTTAAIIQANMQASSTASQAFLYACPVRWQVKCQAIKIATGALEEIFKSTYEQSPAKSPSFNPVLAKSVISDLSGVESTPHSHKPTPSFLALHFNEVLAVACTSSVATLDQSELRWLQETAIHFLAKLVECFGIIADPEQPNTCILSQYSTQIVSSVKHALSAADEGNCDASLRLFVAGCMALQAVIKSGLAEDTGMLKRLVRLIVPSPAEVPFFAHHNGIQDVSHRKDDTAYKMQRSSLLPLVNKLWTLGRIHLLSDTLLEPIVDIPTTSKIGVAAFSAALAIDGARLLLGSGFTLCGVLSPGLFDQVALAGSLHGSAFLYYNVKDIDDCLKASMARSWATCASSALCSFIEVLNQDQEANTVRSECLVWAGQLVPLIFAGLFDSLSAANGCDESSNVVSWIPSLDHSGQAADCLQGLAALIKGEQNVEFEDKWFVELERVVSRLSSDILLPALGQNQETKDDTRNPKVGMGLNFRNRTEQELHLITKSCKLIEVVAASEAIAPHERPALMMAVLGPLNVVQSGTVQFTDPKVDFIVVSSLKSATSLITNIRASNSLVKAMLFLSTDILRKDISAPTKEAATRLLSCAVNHDAVTLLMKQAIASDVAEAGNWAAWIAICCKDKDGGAIAKSLSVVRKTLSDYSPPEPQMAALAAVRQVLQQLAPSSLVGRILQKVGAEVFGILHAYGTLKIPQSNNFHRTTACTDSVKVMLVAYQQLSSSEVSDGMALAALLPLIFASLIGLIRFNGLPNHQSPQVSADPALGRMAAQSIVYVARTTPAAFKASMAKMSDQDRAVLELAVRAEMSGYAPTNQAPAKRKLDLKGFKN